MILSELNDYFEGLVNSHKYLARFFSGLKKDFQDDFEHDYPSFHIEPVNIDTDISNGQDNNTFGLAMQVVDILPIDRSVEEYNDKLDVLHGYINDILRKIYVDDVYNITGLITKIPLIDETASNHVGWTIALSLQKNNDSSYCGNLDNFDE